MSNEAALEEADRGNATQTAPLEGQPPAAGVGGVRLSALVREYDGVRAVDSIDLDIADGEFFGLLGPSGCGKSTTLRMIAGLEPPTSGVIEVGGSDVADLPAYRRPVNTVFQNYALFPHLTVFDNIAFGLREQRVGRAERERRVRTLLDRVDLLGREMAKPKQLSGGQQQRVALARALVMRPRVLLLDEPLGALDRKLREQMQILIKEIQHETGTTFIYVTHDQDEAFSMADRVGLMNRGLLEQVGAPADLYRRPASRFAADFVGVSNKIPVVVDAVAGEGRYRIATQDAGSPVVAGGVPGLNGQDAATLIVRPEALVLRSEPVGRLCMPSRVVDVAYLGAQVRYRLESPAFGELIASVPGTADPGYAVGAELHCCVADEAGWVVTS